MDIIPPLSSFNDPTSSTEDKLAAFDAVPLFMKSLPSELGGTSDFSASSSIPPREGETNPSDTLAALQALAYEGDPSEIAQGFREQGNELFKQRKFRDAMGFYARAIEEVGKELSIRERRTLFSNRAACNLELANYGACLRDCSQVLQQQPPTSDEDDPSAVLSDHKTTMKALLRSARALLGLEKLPEALDALERLKSLEGEGEDVGKQYRETVQEKMRVKRGKELEKVEKERRLREGNESMVQALKLRGVVFPRPTTRIPLFHHCPTDVTPPHFEPSSLPATSSPSIPDYAPLNPSPSATTAPYVPWVAPPPSSPLVFPIFLLLPLARPQPTRDLCLEFDERATFHDLLESMDHSPASLELYFSTHLGRVLKIGGKLTLGKVLEMASRPRQGQKAGEKNDGWELKEGWVLEMVGIPKGDERGEEWIKEWKEEVKNGTRAIL
ncbi:HSP70/90 family co-chaperone CNS1 [Sporobolomyces salmoneus]|uniref:HSP70/90 family co-chaperone CNS1 n=1 Tax=Sporobolomyces salmoneus TaxID=183962 RepID=UPI003176FA1F